LETEPKLYGKTFNYYILSKSHNIPLDFLIKYHFYGWNYSELSEHIKITPQLMKITKGYNWNYYYLSDNIHLTWDVVCIALEKNWDYTKLGYNNIKIINLPNDCRTNGGAELLIVEL
jgi:hypothetical protein